MLDRLLAELSAACSQIGYDLGHKYELDANCYEVIKDFIKYLRRDDNDHTVRRYLGECNVLSTDLVKVFVQHSDKEELWDLLLRLLINLTCPSLALFNNILPTEKETRAIYLEIVLHLQKYKTTLANEEVWTVVANRFTKLLKIDPAERTEENDLIIERILTLIRNTLLIAPYDNEKRVDSDANVHDMLIYALDASGISDLLLFIASNLNQQQYHLQMVEIVSLMLREQNATKLASAGMQRSKAEMEQDEAKLLSIRQKESEDKIEKMKKYAGSRYSRFVPTYTVQNMKAIGDNQMICHKPYGSVETVEFSRNKSKVKKAKNRIPQNVLKNEERTSSLAVRIILKEFCVEFLNGVYNPVMKYARSYIVGGEHTPGDASYYMWAMRFFMEFNRNYKFNVKFVRCHSVDIDIDTLVETVSTETFSLVQRQMEHYHDMMNTDKQKYSSWGAKLHLAIKAYQELLHTLLAMDKSDDKSVRESAKVIKSNIFYVPEYRETVLNQLLGYNETKMTKDYLADLIRTTHVFLALLERFTKSQNMVVQKVKQKKKKRSSKKSSSKATQPKNLEERWDDSSQELSCVMAEGKIPVVSPFDPALDTPFEDQKADAMKRIQKLLRSREFEHAIGLLRSAREVWPENDCFGHKEMAQEEEYLALRQIFFADLGVVEELETTDATRGDAESLLNNADHSNGESDEYEDEEERLVFEETNFNFNEFLYRFANLKIVKAMAILLRNFDTNPNELNHCVIKMLHRIAFDCKMQGMLFQASLFRTFQKIFESKKPEHEEMKKFARYIIRQFTAIAQRNKKVYMELLFWKTTLNANRLVEGYDTQPENKKVSRNFWSEVEEEELRTLFLEHQTEKYSQDLVDWLLDNLINKDRTRHGVMKKLKELGLIVNSKKTRSEIAKKLPKEWSEEEISQLKELWEQLKDDNDPVSLIHNGLRIKRPVTKIKDKLLELGLVEDRKALRKKQAKKSNVGKSSWETQRSEDENSDESDSDRDSTTSTSSPRVHRKKTNNKKKRDRIRIEYADFQLSGLLKDVISKGMTESLQWIKESLEDCLADNDEESEEGVPLVPYTEQLSEVVESSSLQRLFRALGFDEPVSEERYWRIPANMLTASMKNRVELIDAALRGEFRQEEGPPPPVELDLFDSSDDEKEESLGKLTKRWTKRISAQTDSDSEIEDNKKESSALNRLESTEKPNKVEHSSATNQKSIGKRQLLSSDSESERDESELQASTRSKSPLRSAESNSNESVSELNGKKKGKRILVESDSSDAESETNKNVEDDIKQNAESSGSESQPSKKRRILQSDDEDDQEDNESIAKQPKLKQQRVLVSEDED